MGNASGYYFLGTADDEVVRLSLQHETWRETVLGTWRRAGLRSGMRVVDVGAGPGSATWDLAEAVGPTGLVVAVERSERFVRQLDEEIARRGLTQVRAIRGESRRQRFRNPARASPRCRKARASDPQARP